MLNKQLDTETTDRTGIPLRVLVVEDNPRDAELQIATLARAGYLVQHKVAPTADIFRQTLGQLDFDIILADYNLQDWTGLDALDILKASGKNIPVIMVTGSLGDEAAVACIKEGASDYVLKDRVARLPLAVRSALKERELLWERVETLEALRQSEEKYRDLFENANDLIYSFTPDGRILYVNRAWKDALEYSDEEIGNLPVSQIIHPDSRESWADQMERSLRAESDEKTDITLVTKSGKRILGEASRTCKFVDGKLSFVRSIIRDITERRQLEEQVRQTVKMEAIGQLAGGVAHDFNNLLTIILGYAESLQDGLGPTEKEYVGEILKASHQAASLTRQLLAFGRRQIMDPQVLDLNYIVDNMENMLRRLIGADFELAARQQPDLGGVKADSGQIEQVILSLVVNARDAMPNGGKIIVETANVDLDEAYAHAHVTVTPGSYVMLAVSDSGVGMDSETMSRIFEPFFTTKEPGKGTGLGLSTVYGIVKQSAGNISVYSEVGRGSTFKVYLPRVQDPAETAGTVASAPQPAQGKETVLLVEDEAPLRSLVRDTLQSSGYKVLEAEDAEHALAILEGYPNPIDMVLTDVVMPQLSGKELAQRSSLLHPETRVLYISGYMEDAGARHGVPDRSTFFLQKPFTAKTLVKKVREVLDTKR